MTHSITKSANGLPVFHRESAAVPMPSVITTERAVLGRMEKHRWLLVRSASKPSLFIRFPATGIHPMAWLTKDIFTFRASLTACKIRKVQGVTVYWRNSSSTRQGHDHVRNANFQCLPSPVCWWVWARRTKAIRSRNSDSARRALSVQKSFDRPVYELTGIIRNSNRRL